MSSYALARALMTEVLDSFEKLEVVLCLARLGAATPLATLACEAGLRDVRAAEAPADLIADGVVATGSDPDRIADGPSAAHVGELVELHRADRMEVVALMATTALERMRARADRAFADAFVIGSKK